jgi:hypothetical protein
MRLKGEMALINRCTFCNKTYNCEWMSKCLEELGAGFEGICVKCASGISHICIECTNKWLDSQHVGEGNLSVGNSY